MLGQKVEGQVVTLQQAAKLYTTVCTCASTSVSTKLLDISKDMSGNFPAVFLATKQHQDFA